MTKNELNRLAELEMLIQQNRWSLSEIHEKLNRFMQKEGLKTIKIRQMHHYMNRLRELGAPLVKERDGRRVIYKYSNPDESIFRQYNTVIEEQKLSDIEFMLSDFGIANLHEHLMEDKTPRVMLDNSPGLRGIKLLSQLYKYILIQQIIKVSYTSFIRKPEKIIFHPRALKQYNRRWYVIGYDGKDFYHKLALDRIQSIEEYTKGKFRHPKEADDWEKFFEPIIGVTFPEGGKRQIIKFRVYGQTKFYIETKPLHPTQEEMKPVKGKKDCYETSINVIPNYELEATLLWFGESVEVMEPLRLRKRLKERLKMTIKRYQP